MVDLLQGRGCMLEGHMTWRNTLFVNFGSIFGDDRKEWVFPQVSLHWTKAPAEHSVWQEAWTLSVWTRADMADSDRTQIPENALEIIPLPSSTCKTNPVGTGLHSQEHQELNANNWYVRVDLSRITIKKNIQTKWLSPLTLFLALLPSGFHGDS